MEARGAPADIGGVRRFVAAAVVAAVTLLPLPAGAL